MGSLWSLGLCIIIVSLNFTCCIGLAEYVIFPGFDAKDTNKTTTTRPQTAAVTSLTIESSTATHESSTATHESSIATHESSTAAHESSTTTHESSTATHESSTTTLGKAKTSSAPKLIKPKLKTTKNTTKAMQVTTTEDPLITNLPYKPYVCPEEEKPLNIGPYEVPTQKDLVVHMKKTLIRLFSSYHKKALFFLKDIREATQATSMIEEKCPVRSKLSYRMCVRYVSNQCEVITKTFVTSLERQRHDVSALNESSICNVSSMKVDPVQLIKTIAMEEASLEFALPGFLRLLGACSGYCQKIQSTSRWKKPKRHMSDQDLVIKHFLSRKN